MNANASATTWIAGSPPARGGVLIRWEVQMILVATRGEFQQAAKGVLIRGAVQVFPVDVPPLAGLLVARAGDAAGVAAGAGVTSGGVTSAAAAAATF